MSSREKDPRRQKEAWTRYSYTRRERRVWLHTTWTKIEDSDYMPENRRRKAGRQKKNKNQARGTVSINPVLPIPSTICYSKSHADVLFMGEILAAHVPSS